MSRRLPLGGKSESGRLLYLGKVNRQYASVWRSLVLWLPQVLKFGGQKENPHLLQACRIIISIPTCVRLEIGVPSPTLRGANP